MDAGITVLAREVTPSGAPSRGLATRRDLDRLRLSGSTTYHTSSPHRKKEEQHLH